MEARFDADADLTRRLACAEADPIAREQLFNQIYGELLRMARVELHRHRRGATLNTRALVNEAYLKLFPGAVGGHFENRRHFFATAAMAMRQVIVDHARSQLRARRGGRVEHVELDRLLDTGEAIQVEAEAERLLAIDSALKRLADRDPRLVEVVELRFFCGLAVDQVADIVGVSVPTIVRASRTARAFLRMELADRD